MVSAEGFLFADDTIQKKQEKKMPFTASLPTLETDILLNAIAKMNWQLMLRKESARAIV